MHIPFSEILLIVLVALLVIKPEHLPDVAFKLGQLVKWLRHSVNKIKTEMDSFSKNKSDSPLS